jgi:HD superfamily phosphohydrolase
MNKIKIINDPIHGMLRFKQEVVYDIIDHPFFQRLRRIKQMGLSSMVYPGANHTRFEHAIGAAYLMQEAINVLRHKEVEITEDEFTASIIAILCHDLGHGPFSHALEYTIIPNSHEVLTLKLMEEFAKSYGQIFNLAIQIFKGDYDKKFLCELVSSQLDVDRLDYLTRDSFFSGVIEGRVGFERLIMMMNVVDNKLVIEEKGIPSVEKFLISRHLMYSQVYHHKTALALEQMLKLLMTECIAAIQRGETIACSPDLYNLISGIQKDHDTSYETISQTFTNIDDIDIMDMIKRNVHAENKVVNVLCNAILKRKLFKVYQYENKVLKSADNKLKQNLYGSLQLDSKIIDRLMVGVDLKLSFYNKDKNPISVLKKDGEVVEFSTYSNTIPLLKDKEEFLIIAPKGN